MPSARCRRTSGYRRTAVGRGAESGATIVETALVVLLFVALLLGITSLCLTAYNRAALRQALDGASRLCASGGTTGSATREDSVKNFVRNEAGRLGLGIRIRAVTVCPVLDPTCAPDDAGTPGALMTISATIESQFLFYTDKFLIDEKITFKNEQF